MFVLNAWHSSKVQRLSNRTATPQLVEVLPCPTRSMGAGECRRPCGALVLPIVVAAARQSAGYQVSYRTLRVLRSVRSNGEQIPGTWSYTTCYLVPGVGLCKMCTSVSLACCSPAAGGFPALSAAGQPRGPSVQQFNAFYWISAELRGACSEHQKPLDWLFCQGVAFRLAEPIGCTENATCFLSAPLFYPLGCLLRCSCIQPAAAAHMFNIIPGTYLLHLACDFSCTSH